MTVYLPKDKEEGILQLIADCLQTHHMTIRELAKLIGKLVSCTVVCPLGKLYYRDLERLKTRSLCLNGNRWDSSCRLNSKCRSELSWWLDNLPNSKTPIVRPNPHYTITFDASSYTWGAVLNGVTAQGHFSPSELPLSINTKETLAIWYGFMSFANYLEHNGGHMLLLSDNTTAVSYVQKMGGVTSELHTKIVRDLWQEATDRNIWLSISYLPGIQNSAADFVLRVLSDRTEWELNAAIFHKICHNLAVNPSINLFASRLNHKLPTYSSFGPDTFCTYVDTFSFSWNEFDCVYAYPPFNLLCRTLAKI